MALRGSEVPADHFGVPDDAGVPGEEAPPRPSSGSMADAVVSYLRRAIIAGEIRPGVRINVKDVQDRFGVSHIPVREAIRQLEAEHLVETIPRRGAFASPVSVDDLVELYDMRRIVEGAVAGRAASRMTDGHLEAVARALGAVDRADRNSDRFVAADRAFHWTILVPGATPLIHRTVGRLWQMSERFVRIGLRIPSTTERSREHHHEIYEAAVARDEHAVRTAYVRHLTLTEDAVRVLSDGEG